MTRRMTSLVAPHTSCHFPGSVIDDQPATLLLQYVRFAFRRKTHATGTLLDLERHPIALHKSAVYSRNHVQGERP